MAWLVLLGSSFLLASITTLNYSVLQLFGLALLFLLAGASFYKQKFLTYLVFTFLCPLLPSQSPQLSTFDFLQFAFLCIAFWWAFSKIKSRNPQFSTTVIGPFLALLITIFSLSMILSLLRQHYVVSEVFLLKLRDSWNVFDSTASSDFIALRTLIYFFEGVIFFYITVDVVDFQRMGKTVRTMIHSALLVSAAGILQYLFKFGLLEHWTRENPNISRINSSFSDPNSLGTYLASILCLTLFAFIAGEHKSRSRYYAGVGVIVLTALIFTASRAAWAATFLTLMLAPVALKFFGMDVSQYLKGVFSWLARRGPYIAVGTLLLLFGVGALLNYTSTQPDSLVKMLLFTFNPNLSADAILKGRVEFWKTAVSVFQEYPVFGSGPGSFRSFLNAPYFVITSENAHNYFLQVLAETGLPGFFLFCLIIGLVIRQTRKHLRNSSDANFLLRFGLLTGLIAFLLTSLTGHPLLLLKLQFFFWGMIGLLLTRQEDSPAAAEPSHFRPRRDILVMAGLLILVPFFGLANDILKTRRLLAYEYGYHRWEKDERGLLFRWTWTQAISILDVQGDVLHLRLRQLNPEVTKEPGTVKLYLDNELLDTVHFFNTNWISLKYLVSPHSNRSRINLRIVADKKYIPADRNDQRELGIAIQNFIWECSGQTPIGVHDQEREGDKTYYWTRSQASFLLDRSGTKLSFRILPNVLAERDPVDVRFYWDRTEIQKQTFTTSKWQSINLQIPDAGGFAGMLTVRVLPTANLKQMNQGEDSRDLGVRIEFPFQWNGTITPVVERVGSLKNARLYGVSNHANRPLRFLLFPFNEFSYRDFKVKTAGRVLQRRPGLASLVSAKQDGWSIIYPDQPFRRSVEAFVWQKVEKEVRLPSGPILIRMKAAAVIDGGDVPIVSLKIDGREVARQPILDDRWTDYYFPVELAHGGSRITVEFLNDFYLAFPKIDRNLLVAQLAIAEASPMISMGEGWEVIKDGLLIAESVDRNLPFTPHSRCYTIEMEK